MKQWQIFGLVLAVMLAMVGCVPAFGQDGLPATDVASYKVGDFTYTSFDSASGPVYVSTNTVGGFTYSNFSNGGQATSYRVGAFKYLRYVAPTGRAAGVLRSRCSGKSCRR